MIKLARVLDPEAPALPRAYAAKFNPGWYPDRMAMVLAEYVEDPVSVVRRIATHDHDWMFWLLQAASVLDVSDYDAALETASSLGLDAVCAKHVEHAIAAQQRRREYQSSRDIAQP